jgi:hypothetical protein
MGALGRSRRRGVDGFLRRPSGALPAALPFVGVEIDTASSRARDDRRLSSDRCRASRHRRERSSLSRMSAQGHPVPEPFSLWVVAREPAQANGSSGSHAAGLYALAWATCLAYGVTHPATARFVNTSASVLSGLIPKVPGGIGAAEAAPRLASSQSRRVDRLRDRPHTASLHLLPPPDLGLPLAAMANTQGLPVRDDDDHAPTWRGDVAVRIERAACGVRSI